MQFGTDPAAAAALVEAEQAAASLNRLGSLKPLGQLRESFILAAGDDGLWIIDQHVAHERVLFEKILRDRQVERVQRQRLLMPLLVELKPEQMVVFARIAEELENNGFEVEPFGPQTLAVKAAPVGLEGAALERTLGEVIEQSSADSDEPMRNEELNRLRTRIAASIACHSAIKVNTALDPKRIEWLLLELGEDQPPNQLPAWTSNSFAVFLEGDPAGLPPNLERLGRWPPRSQERGLQGVIANLEARFFL